MEAPRSHRVAHEVDAPSPTDRPLVVDKASRIPLLLRQHAADKLYEAFRVSRTKESSLKAALEQEIELYKGSKKKDAYKSKLLNELALIKAGKPKREPVSASTLRYEEVASRIDELLVPLELLEQINFPCKERSRVLERLPDQEVQCSRCATAFVPDTYYRMDSPEPCSHHYGRLASLKSFKSRVYSCCQAEAGGDSCTTAAKHVHYNKELYSDDTFVSSVAWPLLPSQLDIVALDGEMCHTERGLELCRLTMVSWDEERILDVLVLPDSPIVDYNTRYSGISAESYAEDGFRAVVPAGLDAKVVSFAELQGAILPLLIGTGTVLLGHSLENDLFHLKLDHKRIIDTSVLYPHNKGQPFRMALRDLTRVHLKQFVQEGSAGHDSYEDCVACLRLLKLKL